jgi:hypothetical protein
LWAVAGAPSAGAALIVVPPEPPAGSGELIGALNGSLRICWLKVQCELRQLFNRPPTAESGGWFSEQSQSFELRAQTTATFPR